MCIRDRYYDDGLRLLRGKNDEYDLIINDSTDPLGHTEGLFTKEFYGSCYKACLLYTSIDKNVLKENDMINVFSVLDMKASFRRFVSKYYMFGSFLVVILAFIGIMNFFNTCLLYTSGEGKFDSTRANTRTDCLYICQ